MGVYLAYYVAHRASFGGSFHFRTEELVALVVGVAALAGGGVLMTSGTRTPRTVDDPWWFGDPTRKIVDARRLIRRGQRGIGVMFEGESIARLFPYPWPQLDEAREIAAIEAVWTLPQYVGPR